MKANDDIRQKVIDAAVGLLGERGLRGLTGPKVAKRAGVRQSHVTYYFPKRSDLIGAVARSYSDSVGAEVLRLMQGGASNDLGDALRALTTAVIGDRKRTRILIGLLMASEEDKKLRRQLQDGILGLRQVMAHALGSKPGDRAPAMLQATLWGLALQHLLLDGQTDAELAADIAHTASHFRFEGLAPKATASKRRPGVA